MINVLKKKSLLNISRINLAFYETSRFIFFAHLFSMRIIKNNVHIVKSLRYSFYSV